jgi:hypothetical protein
MLPQETGKHGTWRIVEHGQAWRAGGTAQAGRNSLDKSTGFDSVILDRAAPTISLSSRMEATVFPKEYPFVRF